VRRLGRPRRPSRPSAKPSRLRAGSYCPIA
jgi:hypothetical protein